MKVATPYMMDLILAIYEWMKQEAIDLLMLIRVETQLAKIILA